MPRILLLGAGKIGSAITHMLSSQGFDLMVADSDALALSYIRHPNVETRVADLFDESALRDLVHGQDAVLSACPFHLTPRVAAAAKAGGAHYFDLTEDVESTRAVKLLALGAKTAFAPQCGLAPGFISIVAADLVKKFDSVRSVCMRVGALPLYPSNALKYNLTWSTDGLINEYCNPCEAIHEGKLIEVLPLEEVEAFSLDGIEYEAFNTSGGLGTLCETLGGRVETLNYKTVRYPGHRDIAKLLVQDLRLSHRRDILKDVLETAIPITSQDVVLVFVTVSGMREGRLTQETYARKVYSREIGGRLMSAIQITTAAGICAMLDLMLEGALPQCGFVRQEQASLEAFLANRFGRLYVGGDIAQGAAHAL
jgi:saccharopine dehydrogenase-like NADP-dependent oxidoreductase